MPARTISEIISSLPNVQSEQIKAPPYKAADQDIIPCPVCVGPPIPELCAPPRGWVGECYACEDTQKVSLKEVYGKPGLPDERPCVGLAVASMRDHMTDEGFQLFQGLQEAGYVLNGHGIPVMENLNGLTDVTHIVDCFRPKTIVVQDKREWDLGAKDFRDPAAGFRNIEYLSYRPDIFKVTVIKDAHQRPDYHRASAVEMHCHAWIVYYHPRIVAHVAPYVRPQHLIRTYHSINSRLVPTYMSEGREGCLLSGAVSSVYPLRQHLFSHNYTLPKTTVLRHPGYHRRGCQTPEYFKVLSRHKVAICTSSIYGYSLRKIVEATACGCQVITDLPEDEVLPEIDGNLIRITPDFKVHRVGKILLDLYAGYDPVKQADFAEKAKWFYDFRAVGRRLADDIETLRRSWK